MAGGRPAGEQVPVTFEEVVVYFSPEEWVELAEWQKELYQDVMAENYELVSSLECLLAIPELLSQLLRGEALSSPGTPSPARNSSAQVNDIQSVKEGERVSDALQPLEPDSDLLRGIRPHHSQTARKGSRKAISTAQQKPGGAGQTAKESSTQKPKSRKRKKLYKCPKCQRRFLGRPALSAHRRLHIRKWPRICLQGRARPSHTPDSVVPLEGQLGTGASPLPCSQGEGTLPFWPEMALHHQAPAAHSFNPWSLGYGPQPLPGHQAPGLHSNGEFICDQCGWSFHGWEELVTHQMAHMAAAEGIAGSVPKAGALSQLASDRPYACTQCGKSFRHKPNLLAHRQVHTGERRYQCQECGKSFGSKAYLASHQHIHTGEKPYVCGQCGKSFRHKPNLISHQKIHTREPLPAPSHPLDAFTGDNFQSQHPMLDSLGLEVFQPGRPLADTHLPCPQSEALVPQLPGTLPSPQPQVDRPFVCPVCTKQFRCKPYLVAHIRIHTGEKPYACSRCPKRFSQKSNLVSHERLHTGEKPYACPLCPRVFSQGSNMRAHQRSHRNVGPGEVGGCLRPQQEYMSHQLQPPN